MPITAGVALLVGSIIAALAGAGAGIYGTAKNAELTRETNEENKKMQDEINAQNQYNIEHAHQIEMKDLQAAGLNPILTATGGNGAPMASLSAPRNIAPQVDLSAVNNALSGLMSNMTMMTLLNEKNSLLQQQNDIIAGRTAHQSDYYDSRTQYLNKKIASMGTNGASQSAVNSATQIHNAANKKLSEKEIQRLIKIAKFNLYD